MLGHDITQTHAWAQLFAHHNEIGDKHMREWFEQDSERFAKMHEHLDGMLVDYSKNRITEESLPLLTELADAADLAQWRERMFTGDKINFSEHRAVLHTALRQPRDVVIVVDGVNVVAEAYAALDEALDFAELVRSGVHLGHSGERIRHVINIGIGGSDLGPKMVVEALQAYASSEVQVRFVSNVDGAHLSQVLQGIRPETTLFIVASKSFTTPETLLNAQAAKVKTVKP